MATLRAHVTHFGRHIQRQVTKVFGRDWLPYAAWPFTSWLFSLLAFFSRPTNPENCDKGLALVLLGKTDNCKSGRVPGEDLSKVATQWASETLGFRDVKAVTCLRTVTESPDVIILTHDWQLESVAEGFARVWEVIRFARKHKCPVFAMLPDGFRLDLTRQSSLILSLAGGSSILLQDNAKEASKYGMIFPSSTHFWNWPPSRVETWRSSTPLKRRQPIAIIPRSGGGDYRSLVADYMEFQLRESGFGIAPTNHQLDWASYIQLQKSAQISVTTCLMQPWYFKGPKFYQERLPKFVITGRVWEAFSTANLLITEDNHLLRDLGFVPDKHFLALPSLEQMSKGVTFELPEKSVLARVASAGYEHFVSCVETRIQRGSGG